MPESLVFPKPQRVEVTGKVRPGDERLLLAVNEARRLLPPTLGASDETVRLPGLILRVHAGACGVSAADAQGYTLRINESSIEIESWTRAGVRYGLETLHQWLIANQGQVRCAEIQDAPAFATRGVMLDVSRCRIPTMTEFAKIIDQLATLKCNHLQLYTEHTFAYTFGESVWDGWSPITPAELSQIDEMCRVRGIELAANQNCFGHLRQWLETPDFASLAETHGDWMFDIWPRSGPFSLCPTDSASIAFVRRMLAELTPCIRSPLVNIGCDETYDIAYGRSKSECDRLGRGTVFAEFVAKLAAEAQALGKRSMFWGDIALSHPECLALMPKEMIALAWGYEPTSPFDAWGTALAGSGMEYWVCPGSSSWRSITGRTSERNGNINAAVSSGLRHGATGVLMCDWGDTGHWQQWPIAINAIAAGLGAAWTGSDVSIDDNAAKSRLLFGPTCSELSSLLDELGDVDLQLREVCGPLSHPSRTRLLNQSALFIDLFKKPAELTAVGDVALWSAALDHLRSLAGPLQSAAAKADSTVAAEVAHTQRMTEFALLRAIARRLPLAESMADPTQWRALKAEHQRLWRIRSREGGLAQSCAFFDQVESNLSFAEAGSV